MANTYKVPKCQWRKWSKGARAVFNSVYSQMRLNQTMFLHPKTDPTTSKRWVTTAWNAAWIAADAVRDLEKGFL